MSLLGPVSRTALDSQAANLMMSDALTYQLLLTSIINGLW